MNAHEQRSGGTILSANGQPMKINLGAQYSPGPLDTAVVLPPMSAGDRVLVPVFGGATRIETVASRLLAGAAAHNTLERCGQDPAYRKSLVDAAVLTAWDLIGTAASYQRPGEERDEGGRMKDEVSAGAPDSAASADEGIEPPMGTD